MAGWTEERVAWLRERALAAGFSLAGVAAATGESEAEIRDGVRFTDWIEAGFAGEMEWLKRRDAEGRLLRSAVRVALPWARSVVLCALNYRAEGPLSIEAADAGAGWIGRYAWSGRLAVEEGLGEGQQKQQGQRTKQGQGEILRVAKDDNCKGQEQEQGQEQGQQRNAGVLRSTPASKNARRGPRSALRMATLKGQGLEGSSGVGDLVATDYHEVLLWRLRVLEAEIREVFAGEVFGDGAGLESRCYVDTGPMVERAVAARAGVGWIGKNTTVIHQGIGSWTLLASIITSVPVEASGWAVEAADRCGSCTRCIEACPTDALIAPRQMDARRCIAYLTIEKKGAIEEELRVGIGRQVFGCDICQDVCPWNRRAPAVADAEMLPRGELINPDLEWLAGLSPAEFRRWFRGSALERTGRRRLRRNVAIAMGNSGEVRFRARLEAWAAGEDAVLAEAARWALGRLAEGGRKG